MRLTCQNTPPSATTPLPAHTKPLCSSIDALAARYQGAGEVSAKGRIVATFGRKHAAAAAQSGGVAGAQPASVQRMHRRASQDAVQPAELLLHHAQALLQPRVLIAQHARLSPM